jgi:hypothetical protein
MVSEAHSGGDGIPAPGDSDAARDGDSAVLCRKGEAIGAVDCAGRLDGLRLFRRVVGEQYAQPMFSDTAQNESTKPMTDTRDRLFWSRGAIQAIFITRPSRKDSCWCTSAAVCIFLHP